SVEAIDKTAQYGVGIAECGAEPGKARSRTGPQNLLLEPARQPAECSRVEPAGSERMFQRGEKRHRGKAALGELEDEAQEGAGRRAVQGNTRRIVDLDPPATQFGGNPARKFAVGSDECRRCCRRLE